MLHVSNLRLGFANNSSSSHSIVFFPGVGNRSTSYGRYEFGWEYFKLASKDSKLDYLLVALANNLQYQLGKELAKTVMLQLSGKDYIDDEVFDGYIDHQSAITFPQPFVGVGIDPEFYTDFQNYVLKDGVVIFGGNDNDDSGDNGGTKELPDGITELHNTVARKDGQVWALFNRLNGNKFRFSFDGEIEYTKSSLPELVDIKITDYCPYGCEFCYQGSTVDGKHANDYYLSLLANQLGKYKVFEVALGGGEPTLHPNFVKILQGFREEGVVPNFTTRNLAWITGPDKDKILEYCGSFAYSTENTFDIIKLAKLLEEHKVPKNRVTVQLVSGAMSANTMKSLCKTCLENDINFTILGYKNTGRGQDFKPLATSDETWDSLMQLRGEYPYRKIGIDTVFAEAIQDRLAEMKISPILYHTKDGMFSCYIDAVQERIAPSSYCLESDYVALKRNNLDFQDIYRSFATK
jgi:MoaA/NifB/PqqE/SkfB family radical SAM enzyme